MGAPQPAAPTSSAETCSAGFAEFWAAFPQGRKRKKVEALRLFLQIVRGRHRYLPRAAAEELIAGARRYATAMGDNHPYVQMPSSWLRGGCWQDEDVGEPASAGAGDGRGFQQRVKDISWAR